ncbi:uncharacterized protein SETTUDRAFT_27306 [Exserohilum turcica Et28A]|uniref:Uncharacterized protein n=1 Tax=Exserohilum turcicum (strain 28A) TaxID=671987 RepID=R0KKJ5_EXST2|nr:uncharacterized protein SETTUDRAFT_27306 [Exserohilum turcica Et28A]EOA88502.1 hypothetical protein SETTUDRAFT_27306 [Exserohilum turcica Et28A]
MSELAQLALKNDLFLAFGLELILHLWPLRDCFDAVVQRKLLPERFQSAYGSETAIAQTNAIRPKPTMLTRTTTKTVARTLYNTVTEQVTSVSTVTDRHWLTKWTHFPIDPATPCVTWTYYTNTTAVPEQNHTFTPPPDNSTDTHPTTPTATWSSTSWLLPSLLALTSTTLLLLLLVLLLKPHLLIPRPRSANPQTQQKLYQDWKDRAYSVLSDLEQTQRETQRLKQGISTRTAMLELLLGKNLNSDAAMSTTTDDHDDEEEEEEEILHHLVTQKRETDAKTQTQLHTATASNSALLARIQHLEGHNAELRDTIRMRLNSHFVPGVDQSFQELLDEKQKEIAFWRAAFYRERGEEEGAAV